MPLVVIQSPSSLCLLGTGGSYSSGDVNRSLPLDGKVKRCSTLHLSVYNMVLILPPSAVVNLHSRPRFQVKGPRASSLAPVASTVFLFF